MIHAIWIGSVLVWITVGIFVYRAAFVRLLGDSRRHYTDRYRERETSTAFDDAVFQGAMYATFWPFVFLAYPFIKLVKAIGRYIFAETPAEKKRMMAERIREEERELKELEKKYDLNSAEIEIVDSLYKEIIEPTVPIRRPIG
jgi:hypothetical protein